MNPQDTGTANDRESIEWMNPPTNGTANLNFQRPTTPKQTSSPTPTPNPIPNFHFHQMISKGFLKGILIGTVFRIGLLILQRSTELSKYVESPPLLSALFNPLYTLSHLREGHLLTKLTTEGTLLTSDDPRRNFGFAFQSSNVSFFHSVSPLVLAFVDPLFSTVQSHSNQDLIFTIAMMIVDILVAFKLLCLAQNVFGMKHKSKERELLLEQYMNPLIQPPMSWIFSGMEFGSAFVPQEKEGGEKEFTVQTIAREPLIDSSQLPEISALFYFLNPISIIATATTKSSLQGVWFLLLLSAFEEVSREKPNISKATLCLALLSNVELYSIVYLIPLILLLDRVRRDKTLKQCIAGLFRSFSLNASQWLTSPPFLLPACIAFFFIWTLVLQMFGLVLVGSKNYLQSLQQSYIMFYSYLEHHQMNLGLNWYLFMNLFHRFRRSFVVIIAGSSFMLIGPFTVRLWEYPMALVSFHQSVSFYVWVQNILMPFFHFP